MVTLATVLCLPLQDGTPKHVLYTSADLMDPALEHVQHARHLIADLETPALPPDDSISRARDPKSGLNEDQEAAVDRWVAQKTEDVPNACHFWSRSATTPLCCCAWVLLKCCLPPFGS